ncbi:MAG: phage portal protein [Acidimicrobiaceae bacterium]|nr:phage portal protein [Candidatus Poribacteria bacterium]MYI36860.1 phage portal protein [Acidimicrobiaceae bacterium]
MNLLPYFAPVENRSAAYADEVIRLIQSQAQGITREALPAYTGAAQTAAGLIQRALMSAEITPSYLAAALHPELLGQIGRDMALNGESVIHKVINSRRTHLTPASTVTVTGGHDPASWMYDVQLPGPSKTVTVRNVIADNILHFRWSVDTREPWRGVGPLQSAALDTRILAELTSALGDEVTTPHGYFIPIPKTGGQSDSVKLLRSDIASAKGSALIVESMADAWQAGTRGQQARDWGAQRFGADPPNGLTTLYQAVNNMVLEAFGISPQLFDQGAQTREAWRVILFGVIRPLANGIQRELSSKFGVPVELRFADLRASDLQGRARAYKSLIDGGMNATTAQRICGFNE